MTAICGYISSDNVEQTAENCTRMRQALAMFGPHDGEQWNDAGISLGIQKYHTLPEDIYDHQPISDARFTMVADLRLDNRPELAAEFGWTDEEAARRADADFAFAAWEKWGEGSCDKLIGDWALAVWDREEKTLFLARDMMGNRPLFWHQGTDENGAPFFAFASMTQGLFALTTIKMAPDTEFLKFYLALAPMRGNGWFFRDIHRVLPGGITTFSADGSVASRAWYDWSHLREVPVSDDASCIRKFRTLFDRAVSDRLRARGGIASHLSSGFDSTAVATTAAKILAVKGKRLAAYTHVPHRGWQSFVSAGHRADEGPIAARTAATCPNIDHHLVDSAEVEIGADLTGNFYYGQSPMLNLCTQVWSNEIARQAAKNGASVLLSGAMGNMTISLKGLEKQADDFRHGHLLTWWREVWIMRSAGYSIRGSLYRTFGRFLPGGVVNLLRRALGQSIRKIVFFSTLRRGVAQSRSFRAALKARHYDPVFRPFASVRQQAQAAILRSDRRGVRHHKDLAQHGIDFRDPTCDRRLMEFSLSLPARMWLRNGQTRWLYRQAFAGQVPEEVLRQAGCPAEQNADWPERMRRSWESLKMEMSPALEDPEVDALLDTGFYRKIMARPFPAKMNEARLIHYRVKFLRGLSVAHFIRRANLHN